MSKEKLDQFVENLQEEIKRREIEEYNEHIVNLFHNPRNFGTLPKEETTVAHSYTGPCGDTMIFFLKIKNTIIQKARFITNGCGASFATASQTLLLIEGKTVKFAENLTPEKIDEALNGLPEDHKHCADLAANTLKRALKKYKRDL